MSKKVTKLGESSGCCRSSEWGVTGASRGSGDGSLAVGQGMGSDEGRECACCFAGVDKAGVDRWGDTRERAVHLLVAMASHRLSSWPLEHWRKGCPIPWASSVEQVGVGGEWVGLGGKGVG